MDDRKKALEDKLDAELDQARLEIERLEAKAREEEADARLDIEEQVRELKEKRDAAAAKLDEVRQSGIDALEDLKVGAEHAWQALSTSARKAADRFR